MVEVKKDIHELVVNDGDRRLVEGYASVEIVDRQGDIVPVGALERAMLKYMERGGNVLYGHENKPVGRVLQWQIIDHPEYNVPAVRVVAMLNSGYKIEDQVWDYVKDKKLKGFSIGGTALQSKSFTNDKTGERAKMLEDLELSEISIVAEPANQGALLTGHSVAKGMIHTVDDVSKDSPKFDSEGKLISADTKYKRSTQRFDPGTQYHGEMVSAVGRVAAEDAHELAAFLNRASGPEQEEIISQYMSLQNKRQTEMAADAPEIYRVINRNFYVSYDPVDRLWYPGKQYKKSDITKARPLGSPDVNRKGAPKPTYSYLYACSRAAKELPEIGDNTQRAFQLCGFLYWNTAKGDIGQANRDAFYEYTVNGIPREIVDKWIDLHNRQHPDDIIVPTAGVGGNGQLDAYSLGQQTAEFRGWQTDEDINTSELRSVLNRQLIQNKEIDEKEYEQLLIDAVNGARDKIQVNQLHAMGKSIVKAVRVEIQKPFHGFADWADCIKHIKARGKSKKSAQRICGRLKADYEKQIRKYNPADRQEFDEGQQRDYDLALEAAKAFEDEFRPFVVDIVTAKAITDEMSKRHVGFDDKMVELRRALNWLASKREYQEAVEHLGIGDGAVYADKPGDVFGLYREAASYWEAARNKFDEVYNLLRMIPYMQDVTRANPDINRIKIDKEIGSMFMRAVQPVFESFGIWRFSNVTEKGLKVKELIRTMKGKRVNIGGEWFDKGKIDELEKKKYPFPKCVRDQKAKGHSDESAHKICGYIRWKNSGIAQNIKYKQSIQGIVEKSNSFEDCYNRAINGGAMPDDAKAACGFMLYQKADSKKKSLFLKLILGHNKLKKGDNTMVKTIIKDGSEAKLDKVIELLEALKDGFAALGLFEEGEEEFADEVGAEAVEEEELAESPEEAEIEEKAVKPVPKVKANVASASKSPEEFPEDAGLSQKVRAGRTIPSNAEAEDDMKIDGPAKFSNTSGGLTDEKTSDAPSKTRPEAKVETIKSVEKAFGPYNSVGKLPPQQEVGDVEKGIDSGDEFTKGLFDVLVGKKRAADVTFKKSQERAF